MDVRQGNLKSFDLSSYTAAVQLSGDNRAYLEGVKVARNIDAGEMTAGRRVAVIFFDKHNAGEAVVAAVYE